MYEWCVYVELVMCCHKKHSFSFKLFVRYLPIQCVFDAKKKLAKIKKRNISNEKKKKEKNIFEAIWWYRTCIHAVYMCEYKIVRENFGLRFGSVLRRKKCMYEFRGKRFGLFGYHFLHVCTVEMQAFLNRYTSQKEKKSRENVHITSFGFNSNPPGSFFLFRIFFSIGNCRCVLFDLFRSEVK